MRDKIVKYIVERLAKEREKIRADFQKDKKIKTHFATIDNLLPEEIARKIFIEFPSFEQMRLSDNLREKSYTLNSLKKCKPLISDAVFAFQDEQIIKILSEITETEEIVGDPLLSAGNISAMAKGHFSNPHLDNSHDSGRENYRILNLLYFCSPDWQAEYGGKLELWNENINEAVEIPSLFNRLVVMSTNEKSWYSVSEIKKDGVRCCISNFYFSENSPNGYETYHPNYFKARPEQVVRRIITNAESDIRNIFNKVKNKGLNKKNLLENLKK